MDGWMDDGWMEINTFLIDHSLPYTKHYIILRLYCILYVTHTINVLIEILVSVLN